MATHDDITSESGRGPDVAPGHASREQDEIRRNPMKRKFQLDRRNGKVAGVCAGIADYTGWDVTLVRVGLVLITLLGLFPWTLIAYGVAGFVAKDRGARPDAAPARIKSSTYRLNRSMRDIDRRMAEVEQYVTTSNSPLAREIESLR